MKLGKAITLFVVISILAACGQTTPSTQPTPTPQPQPEPSEVTLKDVTFLANTGKQTTGNVKLIQKGESYSLKLSDGFSITAGPDLHVWLLKSDTDIANHLSIGKLSSNTGAQTFAIPAGTDVSSYKVVFIWCEQFGALFATAYLEGAPTPKTTFTGTFTKSSTGSFEIVQTGVARALKLSDDFKANGLQNIDLWLAKDAAGTGYIEYSDIKTTGAQSFDIATDVDLSVYKYVVVWCDEVNVVIGVAELMAAN